MTGGGASRPPAAGAVETRPLRGARVLVLGLGRFGGGVACARFLSAEGASCRISDAGDPRTLAGPAARAEALGAELCFGPQGPELLDGVDLLIASPAIPFDHPLLGAAEARGVPLTTESNLVLARSPAPVLGVTGTKGKSTTTHLLAHALEGAGRTVHLGGNIGRPLLGDLPGILPKDRVVLELSSFQLWWARRLGISPPVAVLTNFFPDHLDRHGDMEAYAACKRALFAYQGPEDHAVLPADDEAVSHYGFDGGGGRVTTYGERRGDLCYGDGWLVDAAGERVLDLRDLPLPGRHNLRNAAAAAAAALCDAPERREGIRAGLLATPALPHRLQPVGERGGVLYYDDSNATNPESVRCALEALDRPVVLLAGGKDKGVAPDGLIATIRQGARALVGLGTTGPALVRALADHMPTALAPGGMEEAVARARALARPGDCVLLSPGHSSLDEYASFAERGERFQAAVTAL